MADDLVLTPGGYRPKSQVHLIEPNFVLRQTGTVIQKLDRANKVIFDFGAIEPKPPGHPLMPHNVVHSHADSHNAAVPDLGKGWIVYADWSNNSGHPVSSFATTWVVPPEPSTNSGQTVFLFNGIQNATMIYQPVLQWGPSAAGGGAYWSVASWYADGQNGKSFHSSLQRVAVGQTLVGVMTLTGQSPSGFSYNCEFRGIANASLPIQNVQELTWCIETLEAYGIKSRSDYPATCRTAMGAIELKVGEAEAKVTWSPVNSVTDTGQHCVVVSSASPGGEVDLYYSNTSVLSDKTVLGDTSPVSPAIASLNGRLYLAWKGDGNDNLNVMFSADNGRTFGHKLTSRETSPQPPALCAHGGGLMIAWKGDGNDQLNVAHVDIAGASLTGFSGKVVLGDTSPFNPSLASFNGRLFIAWKGDGNNNLNLMYSTDNGRTFGHKYTSPERSTQAPSLCVHNGNLYVAWKGDGNDQLNVALVQMSGDAIQGLVNKAVLGDTSPVGPTIASFGGRLYIGWKGDGNDNLNVMYSADNGHTFGHKMTAADTSPRAPALGADAQSLFIAWKGDGNDNLNVAQVRACG